MWSNLSTGEAEAGWLLAVQVQLRRHTEILLLTQYRHHWCLCLRLHFVGEKPLSVYEALGTIPSATMGRITRSPL